MTHHKKPNGQIDLGGGKKKNDRRRKPKTEIKGMIVSSNDSSITANSKTITCPLKTAVIKMINHLWWRWWEKTNNMNLCCAILIPIQEKKHWNICSLHKALEEWKGCQTDQYQIWPFTQLDKEQSGVLSTLKLNFSHLKFPVLFFRSDNFSIGDWTWTTDLESAAPIQVSKHSNVQLNSWV